MRSAVILAVDLPPALEAFRRTHAHDAPLGVPAHLTLLFPWLAAEDLDEGHRGRIARSAAELLPFDYRLATVERWPDTLYAAPLPTAHLTDLANRLAGDWPEWPLYGDGAPFEAHVTLGAPCDAAEEEEMFAVAATCLPAPQRASELRVIVEADDGSWHTRWRVPLGAGPV